MSLAGELLRNLSAPQVNDQEDTLIIDHYTRTIIIPKRITNLGVEKDDDVLVLNFRMPQYLGTVDLSAFGIRINYINAAGDSDAYEVTDAKVLGDNLIFSWKVGPLAVAYKGDTKFNVCLIKLKENSTEVDQEYHTAVASLPVLEGLEVDETQVEAYSDLIAQWHTLLFDTGDSVIENIINTSQREQGYVVLKGEEVRATFPEGYTTAWEMIDNADRTKSDAIVRTAEGEIITVADSSDDYLRRLRIFGKTTQVKTTGKNLLDVSPIVGHTSLINNGGVITVITPSASTAVSTDKKLKDLAPLLNVGETYILTFNSTGTSNYIYLEGDNRLWTSGDSLTITQTMLDSTVLLYASGVSTVAKLSNMMIRSATIDDATYEPYSRGIPSPSPMMSQPMASIVNPSVFVYGKNLISCDDIDIVETDGYYHTFETGFKPIVGETYTLSMDVTTDVLPFAINIGCGQYAYNADMTPKISGSYSQNGRVSLTFVWQPTPTQLANNHTKLFIRAPRYGSPTTFNASVSNIQLELGSNATAYEPYRGQQNNVLPHTLPAVPVSEGGNYTDATGQQWVCDEIDFERGVYVQRTKTLVFNGSENWYISAAQFSSGTRFDVNINDAPQALSQDILCDRFIFKGANAGVETAWVLPDNAAFRIITEKVSTVDELTQFLANNPITVIYTIKTPIETPLTADEIRWFKFAHTNFPNTTVVNDAGATMQLKYNADTKTYLDNLPKATDEQVKSSIDEYLDASTIVRDAIGEEVQERIKPEVEEYFVDHPIDSTVVDKLCPAFTGSGTVVTCNPVEGYPLSVTAQPEATKVTRCGKNLVYCTSSYSGTTGDLEYARTKGNSFITLNGTAPAGGAAVRATSEIALKAGTYTLSVHGLNDHNDGFHDRVYLGYYDPPEPKPENEKIPGYALPSKKLTVILDADRTIHLQVVLKAQSSYTSANVYYQIEAGNTATAYEQYNGGTFAPGETVPALPGVNTLFADSGEITVTGRADTNHLVNTLLERVAALEAAATSNT